MQYVSQERIGQRDRIIKALGESEEKGFWVTSKIVKQILGSDYTDHTKKTYLSWLRGAIRKEFPESSILGLFRISDGAQGRLKRDKSQRIQARLRNKTLISFKDHLEIASLLLGADYMPLQVLGLLLASGRRCGELDFNNFHELGGAEEESSQNSLLFSGQLKTKRPILYAIPLLCDNSLFLKRLGSLKVEERERLRGITWRLSHRLFRHSVHGLRARYSSLVLFKEGFLKSSSLKDPLMRTKELLGHEWESDATFSYQDFAVKGASIKSDQEIIARIRGIKILEKKIDFQPQDTSKRKFKPSLVLEELWANLNREKLFLERSDWSAILAREYKQKTGNTLRFPDLKFFLDQKKV